MAITPQAGYIVDPNNPNAVIKADSVNMPGSVASINQPSSNIAFGAVNNPISVSTLTSNQQPISVTNPNVDYFNNVGNSAIAGAAIPSPTPTETSTTTTEPQVSSFQNILGKFLPEGFSLTPSTSLVEEQKRLKGTPEYLSTQKEVNDLTAKLAQIKTKYDLAPIVLEKDAIGRGVTTDILNRQSAARQRDYAIEALPVTAALNAAQGRLDMANQNISELLQLQAKDQENTYRYQSDILSRAMEFASAEQKDQLQRRQEFLDTQKANQDQFNNLKNGYVKAAIDAGNFKIAGQIATATDLNSIGSLVSELTAPTKLESGIVGEYQYAVSQGYKGSFIDYQNEDANRKKAIAAAGVAQPIPTTQDITNPETIKDLNRVNLINNALNDPNFDSAFGAKGIISRNVPGNPAQTVYANVQQIIDQASLAARGQLKGQGQISDFEGRMLANAQTALRFTLNPEDARQALVNIRGAIITSTGGAASVKVTSKDGKTKYGSLTQQEITDAISQGYVVTYQ